MKILSLKIGSTEVDRYKVICPISHYTTTYTTQTVSVVNRGSRNGQLQGTGAVGIFQPGGYN